MKLLVRLSRKIWKKKSCFFSLLWSLWSNDPRTLAWNPGRFSKGCWLYSPGLEGDRTDFPPGLFAEPLPWTVLVLWTARASARHPSPFVFPPSLIVGQQILRFWRISESKSTSQTQTETSVLARLAGSIKSRVDNPNLTSSAQIFQNVYCALCQTTSGFSRYVLHQPQLLWEMLTILALVINWVLQAPICESRCDRGVGEAPVPSFGMRETIHGAQGSVSLRNPSLWVLRHKFLQ